jgi:superfamily I DNA/RNA helicase
MTAGEKRVARRLESHLDDDYLCWFDIPVGRRRRYPDFIVLHPARGILFLEVKDWRLENIRKLSKAKVELLTDNGRVTVANPIEQARQCSYQVINLFQADTQLTHRNGPNMGKLSFPYGYGVIFTNITRANLTEALTEEGEHLLPPHLVVCKDELQETVDPEQFQRRLWGMFNYSFASKLGLPEIERIRWHLFPELRIGPAQMDIILDEADESTGYATAGKVSVPDVIRVMDLQQEQLARSLGSGHRVIHGVAGSGKTLILGFRCVQLAGLLDKPTLVLCFNVTLAARLRNYAAERGVAGKVQVYHFHDWCGQQLKLFHVDVADGEQPYWERQVTSVISGVEAKAIPSGQYGAVLIDEGHDFEPEWLRLVTQMVDPDTDSLLLLYDDAQSIYRKQGGLTFSLSSVGVKARGRTTILKLNYRNTREILELAYRFAEEFISEKASDEDHIPIVAPESAGASGPAPVFRQFGSAAEENGFLIRCIRKWLAEGKQASEIAVLCPNRQTAERYGRALTHKGLDNLCMVDRQSKRAYDASIPRLNVMTVHSSKGLEFDTVALVAVDRLRAGGEDYSDAARLMYVGMTRAKQQLLITSSADTAFTGRLVEMLAP